jgi:hypothetical protein
VMLFYFRSDHLLDFGSVLEELPLGCYVREHADSLSLSNGPSSACCNLGFAPPFLVGV